MLVVIVPNKQTVYPEKLPAYHHRKKTRIDQFDALLERERVPYLDLRKALSERKSAVDVYYRTDSHWNQDGAYTGFREISAWLGTHVPGYPDIQANQYRVEKHARVGGDLASLLNMVESFKDEEVSYTDDVPSPAGRQLAPYTRVYEAGPPGALRGLLLGDSFSSALERFFAPRFAQLVSVYNNNARLTYGEKELERDRPNVVILEMAERYIPGVQAAAQ